MGNTAEVRRSPSLPAVHPHVRGEHQELDIFIVQLDGPSPRAWGTLTCFFRSPGLHRSIPTCVGNTRRTTLNGPWPTVHPHVRGEHASEKSGGFVHSGPSPRAWGTPSRVPMGAISNRSIPTCVGNTDYSGRPPSPGAVHPHVRGEHFSNVEQTLKIRGPSPRAWGTLCFRRNFTANYRSIPTCVGNT